MSELDGFARDNFTFSATTHDVYRRGNGPAVIVIAEVPGITPTVAQFATRVAELGCTAVLPHLFGTPGQPRGVVNSAQAIAKACVSREFTMFASRQPSPVTEWLRALARHEHERSGGPGVGVVGMCLTGGFALAMAVDDTVIAPVMSQPSLPFGLDPRGSNDLGVTDQGLAKVKARTVEDGLQVLGLRFSADRLCPARRFDRLQRELGDAFIRVDIDSGLRNPYGNSLLAHSVLTEDLVDRQGHPTRDALDKVLGFLSERLVA